MLILVESEKCVNRTEGREAPVQAQPGGLETHVGCMVSNDQGIRGSPARVKQSVRQRSSAAPQNQHFQINKCGKCFAFHTCTAVISRGPNESVYSVTRSSEEHHRNICKDAHVGTTVTVLNTINQA